jgi:hypothetical protein
LRVMPEDRKGARADESWSHTGSAVPPGLLAVYSRATQGLRPFDKLRAGSGLTNAAASRLERCLLRLFRIIGPRHRLFRYSFTHGLRGCGKTRVILFAATSGAKAPHILGHLRGPGRPTLPRLYEHFRVFPHPLTPWAAFFRRFAAETGFSFDGKMVIATALGFALATGKHVLPGVL